MNIIRYFTGEPCPKGHDVERYTGGRICVLCAKGTADKFKKERPFEVVAYNRQYQKQKQREPHYRLANRLRKRIGRALSGQRKSGSAVTLLGCPMDVALKYIEGLWYRPEMSWATWGSGPGTWQIDHVRPLSSFDLSDPAQLSDACRISNLQPLWHDDHARKSALDRRRLRQGRKDDPDFDMVKFRADVAALMTPPTAPPPTTVPATLVAKPLIA